MGETRTISERDAVLRERAAWATAHVGKDIHNLHKTGCHECSRALKLAAERYPLPMIERPRVETFGGYDYCVVNEALLARLTGNKRWDLVATTEQFSRITALFKNPTELVPDDGSTRETEG